jgi:signal transduction histidine kinase
LGKVARMTRLTAEATSSVPDSTVVLRLTGSLDRTSASVLYDALDRCLPGEPQLIVLDLSALADAADNAVDAFGRLADQAFAWPGSSVVLSAPGPAVAALLARTARRLPVYPTVEEALAATETWDADRMTLLLGPEVSAAATARRLIDRTLGTWGLSTLRDPARLVVTELVSNAVRHAGTALEVSLSRRPDAIHLSVRDRSTRPPRPGGPVAPTVEGGRGLLVVDLLSRAWGTTPVPDGKVVWASLSRPVGQ